MNLLLGSIVSGAMMILPLLMQMDISKPPGGIAEWAVFVISVGGALGLLQVLMVKLVVNPAIQASLKDIPTRTEFEAHVETDREAHTRMDNFISGYYQRAIGETPGDSRHHARRRGDPQ